MHDSDEVTPSQAQENLSKGAILVDVRERDEWERGHVDGARHIPLGELESRVGELPGETEIICMCRSGRRSAEAQLILGAFQEMGPIYNLNGGILRWVKDGLPIIGSPGE